MCVFFKLHYTKTYEEKEKKRKSLAEAINYYWFSKGHHFMFHFVWVVLVTWWWSCIIIQIHETWKRTALHETYFFQLRYNFLLVFWGCSVWFKFWHIQIFKILTNLLTFSFGWKISVIFRFSCFFLLAFLRINRCWLETH